MPWVVRTLLWQDISRIEDTSRSTLYVNVATLWTRQLPDWRVTRANLAPEVAVFLRVDAAHLEQIRRLCAMLTPWSGSHIGLASYSILLNGRLPDPDLS